MADKPKRYVINKDANGNPVLAALMRSQKHLPASLSSAAVGFKRVGLHYIAFFEPTIAKTRLVSLPTSKIA
jgi:hypothetical protein